MGIYLSCIHCILLEFRIATQLFGHYYLFSSNGIHLLYLDLPHRSLVELVEVDQA